MHHDYHCGGFKKLRFQHNIMAFVGNGFDIQALKDLEASTDTGYESFFHFLKLHNFDESNEIYEEMQELQKTGSRNWSDVEYVIDRLLTKSPSSVDDLRKALAEMQPLFAEFLDHVVPGPIQVSAGQRSMDHTLAIESLSGFLSDLSRDDYARLQFPSTLSHFDIYNFLFVNFNYTSLFDNFIYLDQAQFAPEAFKSGNRNFYFYPNPSGFKNDFPPLNNGFQNDETKYSSYLMTDIIHPHGTQGIPRSLLFGIDSRDSRRDNEDPTIRLAKPFWSQNDRRFEHLFSDTQLFIIFGCSLGFSDGWWWRNIAKALESTVYFNSDKKVNYQPELIIYWHEASPTAQDSPLAETTDDDIKNRFLEAAGFTTDCSPLKERIFVVRFRSDSDRVWLSFSPSPKGRKSKKLPK